MTTLPVPLVPLDQRDLADVSSRSIATSPSSTWRSRSSALVGAWFSTTPMTRARTLFAPRGGNVEVCSDDRLLQTNRRLDGIRIWVGSHFGNEPTIARQQLATRKHHVDGGLREIGHDQNVGQPSGCDRSDFTVDPEMLGSVDRCHLNGRDRAQPLRDRVADDAVHVTLGDQRARVAVVGAEDEVSRIDAGFGDRLHLLGHVVPGGAQPQHRLHALSHTGNGVVGAGPSWSSSGPPAHRRGTARPRSGEA